MNEEDTGKTIDQEEGKEQYVDEHDKTIEEKLRQKLGQCRKEKEEYLAGWQRCQADTINVKQQEETKRHDVIRFATEEIIHSLIPVLDTFRHAFNGKDMNDPYVRGFNHIHTQLISILNQYGLKVIEESGDPLNTAIHETVGTIPVPRREDDNKIMEVIESGYTLHGKVLKPAKVKIGDYKEKAHEQ